MSILHISSVIKFNKKKKVHIVVALMPQFSTHLSCFWLQRNTHIRHLVRSLNTEQPFLIKYIIKKYILKVRFILLLFSLDDF